MAKLRVFNKFDVEPIEEHDLDCLQDWLIESCPSYDENINVFTAELNGLEFDEYSLKLTDSDIVTIIIEPKEPATIFAVVAIITAGYALYQAQQIPDFQDTSSSGNSIYEASARVNSAQPSGVIRNIAGSINIFPDYVVPPTKRYIDHDEFIYFHLGICEGHISLYESNFFISETPISSYEGDIELEIFEPSDNVAGNRASEYWFQSREVLDLELITSLPSLGAGWTLDYSGDQITSYYNGVTTEFPVSVDGDFEITTGSNIGFYRVQSLSGASNEIATVIGLKRAGDDTSRLEVTTKIVQRGRASVRVNIFSSTGAASLNPAVGEIVEWNVINGGENWEGPFLCTPVNETSSSAEVDVLFPQGLVFLDGSGDIQSATVDIEIQWRDSGSDEWNTVPSTSFTSDTYDARGYTVEIDFGSQIKPEFRIRRVTNDSEDINLSDIVQIKRLKCRIDAPSSYSDITTASLRIRGTNALSATAENKINIRGATRKLPTLDEIQNLSWDLSDAATRTDTEWDIPNAENVDSDRFDMLSILSIDFSTDGLNLYLAGVSNDGQLTMQIRQYSLNNPYDIRAANLVGIIDVFPQFSENLRSVSVGDNDTKLYMLYQNGTVAPANRVYFREYSMSTNNINSAVETYNFDTGLTDGGAGNLKLRLDGNKLYYRSLTGDIRQYSMTSWDLSTISYDSVSVNLSGSYMDLRQETGGTNPIEIYIVNPFNIDRYSVTNGDITTATLIDSSGTYTQAIYTTKDYLFHIADAVGATLIRKYSISETSDSRTTRSISRFVSYSLYKAMGAEVVDLVDWDQMAALDALWESRGDWLDAEFKDETTLWEALKICLSVGYAEPTIRNGKFYPVRIAESSDYQQIYTPDIMLDGVQVDHVHYDNQEPDGVDVEYFSLESNGMELVNAYAAGDLATHPARLTAIGITDETRAWRYGMRKRNRDRFKPANISFSTEMDALNSSYGDLIAVVSDMFPQQYGMMIDFDSGTNIATLDFEPDFSAGGSFNIAVRDLNGKYDIVTATEIAGDQVQIQPLSFTPIFDGSVDLPLVSFGNTDEFVKLGIVRGISPISETQVSVSCEEYLTEVYQDDDNAPS